MSSVVSLSVSNTKDIQRMKFTLVLVSCRRSALLLSLANRNPGSIHVNQITKKCIILMIIIILNESVKTNIDFCYATPFFTFLPDKQAAYNLL